MSKVLRIFLAILTLLTVLAMLGFCVLALTIPNVGMFVVCLLLAVGFGYFSYRDYEFFFGRKPNDNDGST